MKRYVPPDRGELFARYQELRGYVNLDDAGMQLAAASWPLVRPHVESLVDDFYEEILRHEEARRVFAGPAQVERLKASLRDWIAELFAGNYDESFVARRWQVGYRHVQIGLQPVWVSVAMTRLREQTLEAILAAWKDSEADLQITLSAVARMMDLDLALIQEAYNAESVADRLHRERDFAEGVIQTAQAVVMVVDGAGNVVRGNAFLADLLGHGSDSAGFGAIGVRNLMATEHGNSFLTFLRQVADGGSPPALETELQRRGAAPRRIRWLARPFLSMPGGSDVTARSDLGQSTPLVLCVGQDITDLTDAQSRLVRQERLAAIGQTMTGLAHESRNAFQRSQAALETLMLELEDRPAAVQLIVRIQRAHDHLLHLYEEVLHFARPLRLELQTLQLPSLLRQTWDHLSSSWSERKVTLEIRDDDSPHPLKADPFAVEQILRNLLENAIEASNPAGRIEATFTPAWVGRVEAIELQIRDFGRGIPEAYADRLFEPFFTTRPRGTGLGLPIARRLAEGHGGRLNVQAAAPGTIATLTLPLIAVPDPEMGVAQDDPRRISNES
jgi:signal transduction histidine kinase